MNDSNTPPASPATVTYFEHWPHPVADEMVAARALLAPRRLTLDMTHDAIWQALAATHVYQVRSTRSELPGPFWVGAELLDRCPQLLAVSTNGSGYDTIDLDACTAAGVLAVNQAGGNKQGVAEHTLGMMLVLSKRIVEADRAMRKVAQLKREEYMGHDALGKTLGIIGLGNVGSHVAKLAGGMLDMRILAHDPFIDTERFAACGAEQVSLDELLASADFVTVHCPRNASSEQMLDARAFALMKPSAYFITTARGGIHDETALAAALAAGRIAGAGLDVWEDEPPALDHPLLGFDNVIVSPHTAGVTHESRANVARGIIEQIELIARGDRPPRLLNPDAWPRYAERHLAIRGRAPGSAARLR